MNLVLQETDDLMISLKNANESHPQNKCNFKTHNLKGVHNLYQPKTTLCKDETGSFNGRF